MSAPRILLLTLTSCIFAAVAGAQCPSIVVIGPAGVIRPGEEVVFRAEVSVAGQSLTYRWSVSAGTMIKGQGTSEITVKTDSSMDGKDFTATVEIATLSATCPKFASETAAVTGIYDPILDSWDTLSKNDVRNRLDNFFADLALNPTHTGILVLTVTKGERMNPKNKRVQFILRHADYRKFDRARLWFRLELGDEIRTTALRLVKPSELLCEKCLMIKGGEIR